MTTTELIKMLKDNECGGVSHKPREISLTINGKYMNNPQITLSSTGDGICGSEIDFDIDGDFFEEQESSQKDIYLQGYSDAMKEHNLFIQNVKEYMDNYNYAKAMEDYRI